VSGDIRSQNAHGVANRLRQLRLAERDRSLLLVEGDEENKLYSNFIDRARCQIKAAYGKLNVLGALAILDAEGFRGLLAVIDADFDALEGRAAPSPNLLRTDTHDLETMLLASPALDRVLSERGDDALLTKFGGVRNVRHKLLELGAPVGYLRWLNERDQAWMRFKDLDMLAFIHEKDLSVDLEALLMTLRNRSKALVVVDAEILRKSAALRDAVHDLWHVCCGHDLVRILSVALRKTLGSNTDADVKPARIEESLRLAFSLSYFRATELYAGMVTWEVNNSPYVVLAHSE
jgi:hypothetical protein